MFTDLDALTLENLVRRVDEAVAKSKQPEVQEAAVRRLQELERKNVEVAKELLGAGPAC